MHLEDEFLFLLKAERRLEEVRAATNLPAEILSIDVRLSGSDHNMDTGINFANPLGHGVSAQFIDQAILVGHSHVDDAEGITFSITVPSFKHFQKFKGTIPAVG